MATFLDLTPAQRKAMVSRNTKADLAVTAGDQAVFGTINVMFLSPILQTFLESIGKYFLFPLAAIAHVFKTILAWRKALIDRKQRSVVGAVVETVATAAIVAAVVGSLVATSMFALATPIMFTAAIGGKTLFQAGSAIYYAGKAAGQKDQAKKQKYRNLATSNGIGALAGAVATAAVVAVFLLGKIALAGIGVAAGIIGVGVAIYKGYRMHKEEEAAKALNGAEQDREHDLDQDSTLGLIGKFRKNGGTEVKKEVVEEDKPEEEVDDDQVLDIDDTAYQQLMYGAPGIGQRTQ